MGGKQNQAQRVKNNARPSNSGRSAEFLGNNLTSFNFTGMKEVGFTAATFTLTPCDDIDSHVDPNFQLVLKKMNKKDSTTKLKALQEFSKLVKNTEAEAVKAILPFWPRFYCVLATDTDHRVREATHIAHNEVVLNAKRNLAPFLKQLAGPWYTSQYDTYAPAATAATKAFKDAFPINKVQEAIIFVQEEILHYICDNLITHTPQTLSNPNVLSSEECKAKYERVVISSLQGYTLYMRQVPADAIRKVLELHKRIISNSKFSKLARNEIALIRASWFGVIAAICENAKFLLDDEIPNVVKAVFLSLDETEPIIQFNLWEAILLMTKSIDEWWKYYNIEEKLLPKLWKVLRETAHGNATAIYPNLLPFISHMPTTINNEQFLIKLFDSMKVGLQQASIRASQSEARVVSVTFIECFKYSIIKNYDQQELCIKLIKGSLVGVLDTCIIDRKVAHKTLFNQISLLVQYWHRNKEESPNYVKYLATFWEECDKSFSVRTSERAAKESEETTCDLCARQIELLVALKHTVRPKQFKVQFTTQEDSCKGSERRNSRTQSNLDQSYLDSLHRLVYNSCVLYIKMVDYDHEKKLPKMIENIVALVQEFESDDLVSHLKHEFCQGEEANAVLLFNMVFEWLKSEQLCSRSVVDLIFLLIKYTDDGELACILDKFIEVLNQDAFCWCISSALSHPHKNRTVIQTWLGNKLIGDFLVRIIEHEIADTSNCDFTLLLKQAFTETNDEDLLIEQAAVDQIVARLNNCLCNPLEYTLTIDNCASLAAYIASSIYTESERSCNYSDTLFLALFEFNCLIKSAEDHDFLSSDTLWEVKTAWHDALVCIAGKQTKEELKSLSNKCAKLFETAVILADIKGNERPIEIISQYLLAVQKTKPLFVDTIAREFLERSFVMDWQKTLFTLGRYVDYMNGAICFPTYVDLNVPQIADEDIEKYFNWKLIIVKTLYSEIGDSDDDDDNNTEENIHTNRLLKLFSEIELTLLELLQDQVIFDKIVSNYTQLKCYCNLKQLHYTFKSAFEELMLSLEPSIKSSFENALNNNVKEQSCLWANPAYTYYIVILKQSIKDVYKLLMSDISYPNRMQLTQVFTQHRSGPGLSYNDIEQQISGFEALVTLASCKFTQLTTEQNMELEVHIVEVYRYIEQLKNETMELKFYNLDFNNWEQTQIIIEILRLFRNVLYYGLPCNIFKQFWDFIVVSLGSWSGKLAKAKVLHSNPQVASFCIEICNLFIRIKENIEEMRRDDPKSTFVDEWENIFVKSVMADLVQMWLYLAEHFSQEKTLKLQDHLLLRDIGNVISHFQRQYVFDCRIDGMPKWSKLLKQSCVLLTSPIQMVQLWGYHMIMVLSHGLTQVDQIAVDTNTPHEKGLIFEQFKDLLDETHNIVSTMLLDFKLGEDSCRVEPFTDSYTYTFAYLLLWDVLLYLCENSSTELRYQYSDWLKKEDLLNSLLSSIFKLMPLEVTQTNSKSKRAISDWFIDKSTILLFNEPTTSEKIERLNCAVLTSLVAQLPATVRQWWSSADPKISQLVERVTSTYISPYLCGMELIKVAEHENKFKNLIVKVYSTMNEVVAIYTVDDARMELVITLPPNYPLGGPDVQCNRQIGGLPHKQWLMQLRMCVMYQNGRIWDALSLWNNNLDKKFEGVEECYICFGVLHPGTYQLPKLSCKTCRKKFHAACLYKWFSTSNKSTCPICRNLF